MNVNCLAVPSAFWVKVIYLSVICVKGSSFCWFQNPLEKYRGITVLFEIETAQKTLNSDFQQAHINLAQIRDTLCADGRSLLINPNMK